jgi:hypothetical protein
MTRSATFAPRALIGPAHRKQGVTIMAAKKKAKKKGKKKK